MGSGTTLIAAEATGRVCLGIELNPAYVDVAAKYKGDKNAVEMLSKKVKDGGTGTWGQIPMPPNASVPPGDIKEIVTWIMTLKK